MTDTFGPDDLMPWDEMTKRVKELERKLEGTPDDVMVWEAILDVRRTLNWDRETITRIEKEIGRISFLSYDAGEQFKLIMRCLEKMKELEGKIETLWKWANDTGAASFASQSGRIRELEEKVESLTRTLDMLQEVIGVEVVITAQALEGLCAKCDRVGQLNDGNICEGCFYEEIGVGDV